MLLTILFVRLPLHRLELGLFSLFHQWCFKDMFRVQEASNQYLVCQALDALALLFLYRGQAEMNEAYSHKLAAA
jgi:hypothetical protein